MINNLRIMKCTQHYLKLIQICRDKNQKNFLQNYTFDTQLTKFTFDHINHSVSDMNQLFSSIIPTRDLRNCA